MKFFVDLKVFVDYLWHDFVVKLNSIFKPMFLAVLLLVLIGIDRVLYNGSKVWLYGFGFIVVVLWTVWRRGDWRHWGKERLYERVGVKRVFAKDVKEKKEVEHEKGIEEGV